MYICYLIALAPLLIGAGLFVANKRVVWWEWLIGTAVAFAVSGAFHYVAISNLTADTETWSGQVTEVIDYPYWEARWTTTETYTDSDGKSHTRTVHHHEVYPEHWTAPDTLGQEHEISKETYLKLRAQLGGVVNKEKPWKDNFDCGDPLVYHTPNTKGELIPTTATRSFENRVKAAKSLFDFSPVPAGAKVYAYPGNRNPFASDRLLGATGVKLIEWDKLNARLGAAKKVNLILVGFGGEPQTAALYQESAWLRGRKNDLVLCFGGDPKRPDWATVFGWTESELVKRNLETVLLEKGVDLPAIESEVRANYTLKDWSKFDYLTLEVPNWYYYLLLGIMALVQGGYWTWANLNEFTKWQAGRKAYW